MLLVIIQYTAKLLSSLREKMVSPTLSREKKKCKKVFFFGRHTTYARNWTDMNIRASLKGNHKNSGADDQSGTSQARNRRRTRALTSIKKNSDHDGTRTHNLHSFGKLALAHLRLYYNSMLAPVPCVFHSYIFSFIKYASNSIDLGCLYVGLAFLCWDLLK